MPKNRMSEATAERVRAKRLPIRMKGYAAYSTAEAKAEAWLAERDTADAFRHLWWTVLAKEDGRFVPAVHVGPDGNPGLWVYSPFMIFN